MYTSIGFFSNCCGRGCLETGQGGSGWELVPPMWDVGCNRGCHACVSNPFIQRATRLDSFLFSLGPKPREWCHPHLRRVFSSLLTQYRNHSQTCPKTCSHGHSKPIKLTVVTKSYVLMELVVAGRGR